MYSFKIVLLDMITNQPVIGGDISKIMDPNVHGDYNFRYAWGALELAMSCEDPAVSTWVDISAA